MSRVPPHEHERAASERDFFLVVVSGLQHGTDTLPTVRIILDPVRQLTARASGNVTLAGVRACRSLTIPFERADRGGNSVGVQVTVPHYSHSNHVAM
ncbi:hypothetical protein [Streptomyces sp. NPDC005078]|uniref:hypothetical protein n=1 Tax=unclassified Streptomyces TaxID=2593676 RepID=UPI0033B4AE6F